VLYAVSCLLGPERSNDNNQASTTSYAFLRHGCFVLTNIDLIAFIPTRKHACV